MVRDTQVLRRIVLAAVLFCSASLAAQEPDDGRPIVVRTSVADFVILDAASTPRLDVDDAMGRAVAACRQAIPIATSDSLRLAALPRLAESPAPGRLWPLEMYVFTADAERRSCGAEVLPGVLAALRGVQVTAFDDVAAPYGVRDVRVLVDDAPAAGPPIEVFAGVRVSPTGVRVVDSAVVRVLLSVEHLAPRPNGTTPRISVALREAGREIGRQVDLPPAVVRSLWMRSLAARAEGLSAREVNPEALAVLPPRASDAGLRVAEEALARGDAAAAARAALERLAAGRLAPDDIRIARVQAGLAFASLGDAVGARSMFAPVVEQDPCFALHASASAEVRGLVDRLVRPAARCKGANVPLALVRGALLPGFGRPTTPTRRIVGVLELGAVLGSLALWQSNASAARATYDEYLEVNPDQVSNEIPSVRARRLYEESNQSREQALMFARTGAVLWAAVTAEAVIAEWRWGRYHGPISSYGQPRAARRVSVTPLIGGGRAGLAFTIGL